MSKTTVSKTQVMVEGALMVALAVILSQFVYSGSWLQGGSISFEMVPIVVMGYRHGNRWGVFTGFVFGFLNMVLGFSNVLYCPTLITQIGCILLDYLVAFSVLGLSGMFADLFGRNAASYACSAVIVSALRFVCHYISGIWLWGGWAPEGTPAWLYSLTYNGTYMAVDAVLTAATVVLLYKGARSLLEKQ